MHDVNADAYPNTATTNHEGTRPAMFDHVLAHMPPAAWAQPISAYLTHLDRSGAPKPTRTLRSYHLRRFAIDSGVAPWDVTIHDLHAHIDRHAHWKPPTRKTFRSSMREFYRWAVDMEHTDRNPADRLATIRVPVGKPRPAGDDAVEEAFASADDRTRLMVRLAVHAGLRCREIALVRANDIQRDVIGIDERGEPRHAWSIVVVGKGERVRRIPCPESLATDLRTVAANNPDGWVFPGRIDGHLSAAHVSKLVGRVLPGGAHTLRHRYGTRAYRLGGRDIRAVQTLLGHASVATTQIYVDVEDDAVRHAALAAAA